jgi:hypothetical protein
MIYHLTASKDAYITNKIVNGASRATTGNTGYASTIDMFKLYGESNITGDTAVQTELSRGLICFDLAHLSSSIMSSIGASSVDKLYDNSNLKIKLQLSDVQGTQVAPVNFELELWPLEAVWDEGLGDNVVTFGDEFPVSWTVAKTGTNWATAGAWESTHAWTTNGDVDGQTYIDKQTFVTGEENLELDVTEWVKALWKNANGTVGTNYGWALKFTAAQEGDTASYFVKRFASRHTRNPFLRPKLVATWEDYYIDDRLDFEADTANTVLIQNYVQGNASDFGETPTCALTYGSFSSPGTVATVSLGGETQTGLYKSDFSAIDSEDTVLGPHLIASGSVLLQEEWKLATKTVYSGSIILKRPLAVATQAPRDYRFSIIDLKSTYTIHDEPVIRLFIRDRNLANESVRIPVQLQSQVINKVYYQIKDTNSEKILIPFSDTAADSDESTRVSADGQGMHFKFPASVLPRGRTYTIDIAYYDRGERRVYESNKAFRIK